MNFYFDESGGLGVETPEMRLAHARKTPMGRKFLDAFGAQGAEWYCDGKTFEKAQLLYANSGSAVTRRGRGEQLSLAAAQAKATAKKPPFDPVIEQRKRDGARFTAAFGQQGAVWFAEGKSFAEAERLFGQQKGAEIADLSARIAESKREIDQLNNRLAAHEYRNSLGDTGLARFVAGIKFAEPGAKSNVDLAAGLAVVRERNEAKNHKSQSSERAFAANGLPSGLARFARGVKLPAKAKS